MILLDGQLGYYDAQFTLITLAQQRLLEFENQVLALSDWDTFRVGLQTGNKHSWCSLASQFLSHERIGGRTVFPGNVVYRLTSNVTNGRSST